MRLPMSWFVVLVSFLVAGLSTSVLAGGPPERPTSPEAREHLDRGNNLYNVGSFAEAIEEYTAGALIEPVAAFDYNLGQANRQLGKYREALWHYDRFLHNGKPKGELRDAVIALMAEMRVHLENKAQTMPPRGTEPSSESSSPTTVPAAPLPEKAQTSARQTVTEPVGRPWYKDKIAVGLGAAGILGLGIGGGLLIDSKSLYSDANATSSNLEYARLRSTAHSRAMLGGVVGAVGVVALTLGVVKLALHHNERSSVARWDVGVSGSGVVVLGDF